MLILTKKQMLDQHMSAKNGLIKHFNSELEKILNTNSKKDKYWILGKVKFEKKDSRVGRTFLEASDTKPPLVKNSFVYEVDNKSGTKTLLWVMNPDDSLRIPSLNKTIQV